jgi:hypothetical protein
MDSADHRRKEVLVLAAYVATSAVCLGVAGLATYRIVSLDRAAHWIDGRLVAQAADYADTLQSQFVDEEMQSFRERHQLLSASATWWQVRLGMLMLWGVVSLAYFVQRTLHSFSREITEMGNV